MRIAVFTPTKLYGGIDIALSSLRRQTVQPDLWIVADELLEERDNLWGQVEDIEPFDIIAFKLPRREGMHTNLESSYNQAIEAALLNGIDLLISMQDYIYLESDVIERFRRSASSQPLALLTGIGNIGLYPGPEAVVHPRGLYTIFDHPRINPPTGTFWFDPRDTGWIGEREGRPVQWEINLAAWSLPVFEKIRFDKQLEAGFGYGNTDYAMQAVKELGAHVEIHSDINFTAYPHQLYFPHERARDESKGLINRDYFVRKWST